MFDSYVRPLIDPPLNHLGKKLATAGLTANTMTLIGFLLGILSISFIMMNQFYWAGCLIACNRLADGLDGAIARQGNLTDFGGFLDIVCDFIIYSGIIFAFGLVQPENIKYASFLMFSFIGPMASFLAYAIIASKRQVMTQKRGKKSFYYVGGICEGTETAIMLILLCFMPQHFKGISLTFGALCWLTTLGRIYGTWLDFGKNS